MDGGAVEQARKLAFCPAAKHDQQRRTVVAGDMQPARRSAEAPHGGKTWPASAARRGENLLLLLLLYYHKTGQKSSLVLFFARV